MSLNPFFSCLLLDRSPVFNTLDHFFTETQSGLSLVFRTESSPVLLLSPWLLLAPLCAHPALSGHPGDAQGSCTLDPSSSHATFSLQGIHHNWSLVSVAISWSLSNVCLSSGLQTCGSDFLPDIPTWMSQRSQKFSMWNVKMNSKWIWIWSQTASSSDLDLRGPALVHRLQRTSSITYSIYETNVGTSVTWDPALSSGTAHPETPNICS